MSYRYEFDDTPVGDFRLPKKDYGILQNGYRLLRDELKVWNRRAIEHGAVTPPYEREVRDLAGMIEWGEESLHKVDASVIAVRSISVGSLQYTKAALMLLASRRKAERADKAQEGWPDTALRSLDAAILQIEKIGQSIELDPSDILWELTPKETIKQEGARTVEWDVFISHASEDKETFVRPLAEGLKAYGLKVWFDEFTLTVGDSLRRSIDRGLAHSRFGIVVISPAFMRKEWPQRELDGLVAREIAGGKVILPIWHGITAEKIREFSPSLADRLSVSSNSGLDHVIAELMRAIGSGDDNSEPEQIETAVIHQHTNSIPHNWQDGTIGGRTDMSPSDPHYWVRMVYGPHIMLKVRFQHGFERISNVQTLQQVRRYLLPLGGARVTGCSTARNAQGPVVFLSADDAPDIAISATQFYSWGELFAVDFHFLRSRDDQAVSEKHFIPTAAVEEILVDGISSAMTFARDGIKASLPFEVQVGLVGVKGYRLAVDHQHFYGDKFVGHIHQDQIADSFSVKSLDDEPFGLLLPLFDKIYDVADQVRPNIRAGGRLRQ